MSHYRIPAADITTTLDTLHGLASFACLTGMEQALLIDAQRLIETMQRYTLMYKVEVF